MLGIFLSICVSFLKASGELAGKIFTDNTKKKNTLDEYALAYGGRIAGAIITLPVVFFVSLQGLDLYYAGILFFSAVLNGIATVTSLRAVKHGDLSLVGPLSAFTIPFLLLSSFILLGEFPNIYGFLGIILIFSGSYILGISGKKTGFLGPIKSLWNNMGARYMLLTTAIWSITTPLDKIGIQQYGVLLWMLYLSIAIALLMSIYSYFYKAESFQIFTQTSALKKISLMTLLGGLMLLLQMYALQLTLAVYVISIKRASGIFSIIFGYFFFKEKNILQKIFAVGIMILGVICITVFGNI